MSTQKKRLAAAIMFCTAVAGGGVAGAVLGTPSISSAQTTDTTTTDDSTADDTARPRRQPGVRLEAAATALGVTTDELRTALLDGQTIADVAAEQGIDVQTVIDAMVADATQRIDEKVASGDLDSARAEELKANLTDRVTDMVNGELPLGRPGGPGGHGHGHGPHGGRGLDAAATALGITVDELHTAIEGGQTIAEVAADNGVDVDAVIDAMVDEARERITARVNGEAPEDAPTGS